MKTANINEFESAELLSSMQDTGSSGSVVAIAGCMLSLLMMLCA